MALKADVHELLDIFSNARTKGEFTSMCTSNYLLECEEWDDYYNLIEAAFECATETNEEKFAEIAAIVKRCKIAPKSLRHHLILDTDLERLLQLSSV